MQLMQYTSKLTKQHILNEQTQFKTHAQFLIKYHKKVFLTVE